MRKSDVYNNLTKLIGTKIDAEKILAAFGNYTENGKKEIHFIKSNNKSFDYVAFVNTEYSTKFTFSVDKSGIINYIEMFD